MSAVGSASIDDLLERLGGKPAAVVTGETLASRPAELPAKSIAQLDQLRKGNGPHESPSVFRPAPPRTAADCKVSEGLLKSLLLKSLLAHIHATGVTLAEQVCLPFQVVLDLLGQLRTDQLVVYKGAAGAGDYIYQLTERGQELAKRYYEQSTYHGAAPIHFDDYIASIQAQNIRQKPIEPANLVRAFEGLTIGPELISRLGQAMDAGKGFFLFGAPGNGKTTIAERVARSFGESIWIPRAVNIDGTIVRVFDPCMHQHVNVDSKVLASIDQRWVCIQRPAICVGGELTLDQLEITTNTETGVSEAALQMKSNCGTLIIDDFGRQRVSVADLLNRWIVPLDRGIDFLRLPSGKTVQVPFEQLLVFSTNLQPHDLVDEAFLRRIPYKIEVEDPSEQQFAALIEYYAGKLGLMSPKSMIDYLIQTYYRPTGRPFRFCQARDLVQQVFHFCRFERQSLVMTPANIDAAVRNYFSATVGI